MNKVPKHIAIIPDGNRRWARQHGLLEYKGHEKGVELFREIAKAARANNIEYLTFWGGSASNLTKRSKIEINFLVSFLKKELANQLKTKEFQSNQTKFRLIGRWNEILEDAELKKISDQLEQATAANAKYHVTILFGYDGKEEMLAAIEKLRSAKTKLDYETVKAQLWTAELPPVDLVIRTGGEPHWSTGFMMWLTTDSQFYFTEKFWPDFNEKEFQAALDEYARRERRLSA